MLCLGNFVSADGIDQID